MLPALHAASLRYWVYGGVGVAGVVGEFFRHNDDVDIYVFEPDFAAARDAVLTVCRSRSDSELVDRAPLPNGRPKFEVLSAGGKKDVLSVVPLYQIAEGIEYRGAKTPFTVPDALVEQQRQIGNYRFVSPPPQAIKRILMNFLEEREPASWRKRRQDAERLFPDELAGIERRWTQGDRRRS